MVSINNNVSFNTSQALIRPRMGSTNTSTKQSEKDSFSASLGDKENKKALPSKIEKVKDDPSVYSPLMIRYGSGKVREIAQIAENFGIDDLTNEDFDYAIRYGRSLLADYLV